MNVLRILLLLIAVFVAIGLVAVLSIVLPNERDPKLTIAESQLHKFNTLFKFEGDIDLYDSNFVCLLLHRICEGKKDPWDREYKLRVLRWEPPQGTIIEFRSAGPDKTVGTSDDIVMTISPTTNRPPPLF